MRLRMSIAAVLAASFVLAPAVASADGSSRAKPNARTAAMPTHSAPMRSGDRTRLRSEDVRNRVSGLLAGGSSRALARSTVAALAAVAPASTPTITAPQDGDTVSGLVTVTADSTATTVRFSSLVLGFSQDVAVDTAGVATVQIRTYGASGLDTITAADCDGTDCGPADSVDVTVDNAPPTLTSPADGSMVGSSFAATASAGGGSVVFYLDGTRQQGDDTAPYDATIDTSLSADGDHLLTAAICNDAGDICDFAHPSLTVTVTKRAGLDPQVTGVSPSLFSPGNDGRKDTTRVSYSLDTGQSVSWSVRTTAGTVVAGPHALGPETAGNHSFVFDGKKNNGTFLPSGTYVVRIETALTGSTLTGRSERLVVVDRTAPTTTNRHASPRTVFPVKDGYRDTTKLSAGLSEDLSQVTIQVRNAKGKVVRRSTTSNVDAGTFGYTWNAREHGSMLRAGKYRYRFVMSDVAGNEATSGDTRVKVSAKKLVKRTLSKTVTADGSFDSKLVGACSDVRSPGARKWKKSVGYDSNYYGCSDNPGEDLASDLASAFHSTRLPRAAKYGAFRVDTYGGKAVPKFNDRAAIIYVKPGGEVSDKARLLTPAVKFHPGPTAGAAFVSSGRRVQWVVATVQGNFYDVKTFRVRSTYYVLR